MVYLFHWRHFFFKLLFHCEKKAIFKILSFMRIKFIFNDYFFMIFVLIVSLQITKW